MNILKQQKKQKKEKKKAKRQARRAERIANGEIQPKMGKMTGSGEEVEIKERYLPKEGEYEPAITVKDVHISYTTMNTISIKKSLKKGGLRSKKNHYEAVRGVSFEVPKGQIVGITGMNGSGKSTLLRAIAGIFSANEGSIDLHGNSVSLMAIGVGFEKQLSGRENILLSGLMMGYTKEQIKQQEQSIIDFSELGDFIDQPVETYSSGMYSKLAFSITAILDTDIILIDEVLAVGDRHFRKKSQRRMQKLIAKRDHTVVIVSHSESTLRKLCDRVIWLDAGTIYEGDVKSLEKNEETGEVITGATKHIYGDGPADEILDAYESYMLGVD